MVRLLSRGPLCVQHLQRILGAGQVTVSKHLGFLRKRGLVRSERRGHWMIYRLPQPRSAALEAALEFLERCVPANPPFAADFDAFDAFAPEIQQVVAPAPEPRSHTPPPLQQPAPPAPEGGLWNLGNDPGYID